ncbi:hypothetical protein MGN70_010531 [Eutypa lata]|nr:hypothetical protein MGN70_010531 [Eutypa lata]
MSNVTKAIPVLNVLGDGQYEFAHYQPWCRVAGKKLKFIDENIELTTNYDEGQSESEDDNQQAHNKSASKPSPPDPLPSIVHSHGQENVTGVNLGPSHIDIPSLLSRDSDTYLPSIVLPDIIEHESPRNDQRLPSQHGLSDPWSLQVQTSFVEDATSRQPENGGIPGGQRHIPSANKYSFPTVTCLGLCKSPLAIESRFPIKDSYKAELIRYYVDSLAPVFDICDAEMAFARTLVEMARTSHTLFDSIFAVSSKHLSSRSDEMKLQRPCSDCFQTAFNSCGTMLSSGLFASIVLLYFHEYIEGKI